MNNLLESGIYVGNFMIDIFVNNVYISSSNCTKFDYNHDRDSLHLHIGNMFVSYFKIDIIEFEHVINNRTKKYNVKIKI